MHHIRACSSNRDVGYHDQRADGTIYPNCDHGKSEPDELLQCGTSPRSHPQPESAFKHNCSYLTRRTILQRKPGTILHVRRWPIYALRPTNSNARVRYRACRTINYSDVHNLDNLHNKPQFRSSLSVREAKTACLGSTVEPGISGGSRGM